jgi:hypothetical protein
MAIHHGISRSEYEQLPGINWSALKCGIGKTADHIKAARAGRKDSPAMRFGRAFHAALLQPEIFSQWETVSTATTKNPLAVTETELNSIERMLASIRSLGLGEPKMCETALTWKYGGVECKCMFDGIWGTTLGDPKSTKDASPAGFGQEIRRYSYHGQIAFYLEGAQRNGLCLSGGMLIAVEKTAPYGAAAYDLSGTYLDQGRKLVEDALEVWADGKTAIYGRSTMDPPDWYNDDEFSEDEDGISLGGDK